MTDAPAATTRGVATTDDLVLAERRGPVVLLTLNRPAKLNAWSNALEDRYFDLLEQADDDPQVRAVVVTGAGRGFCSGADLDDLRHVADATDDDLVRPRPRDFPLRVRKPIVAAIRGPVAGLGLVEALYCDVRFGDATTRFTTAFARRGLIAEYGVTWLLPRVVGHGRAADLLLSSRMIDVGEAHRIGLLDHLVTTGDVVDAAVAYATDLAVRCSPRSMATIKTQLRADADRSYPDAVTAADRLMVEAFRGPDVAEGVASHLERRAPEFAALPGSAHATA